MNYLLCVDVQKEFVKDKKGKEVYERLLKLISKAHLEYTVIAPIYVNLDNINMIRLMQWEEMKTIENVEFRYDLMSFHSGYSIKKYPQFGPKDKVFVVGFDTDACVLSACFDLFNNNVNFSIIADGCWSSGGKKMHEAGLKIMRRQFRKALDTHTKLEQLVKG